MKQQNGQGIYGYLVVIVIIVFTTSIFLLRLTRLPAEWSANVANIFLYKQWPVPDIYCQDNAIASLENENFTNGVNEWGDWIQRGRLAWLVGNCLEAQASWQNGTAISPHHVIGKLLLAHSLYANGAVEEAIELYRQIGAADHLFTMGERYENDDILSKAVEIYELSYAVQPQPNTAIALSEIYRATNQPEKALTVLQQVENMTGENDADYWWAVGYSAELLEDLPKAKKAYKQGSVLAADRYPFYWQMANICNREGDLDCARQYYLLAAEDKPLRIRPLLALGDIHRIAGDYETAITYYLQANEVYPESELPEYYQGIAFWRQGDLEKAIESLSDAHEQNPGNWEILRDLGLVFYENGNYSAAVDSYQTMISQSADVSWQQIEQLGNWYLEQGNCLEADALYQRFAADGHYSAEQVETFHAHLNDICSGLQNK